jgi:hypothetical protein
MIDRKNISILCLIVIGLAILCLIRKGVKPQFVSESRTTLVCPLFWLAR